MGKKKTTKEIFAEMKTEGIREKTINGVYYNSCLPATKKEEKETIEYLKKHMDKLEEGETTESIINSRTIETRQSYQKMYEIFERWEKSNCINKSEKKQVSKCLLDLRIFFEDYMILYHDEMHEKFIKEGE